MSTQCYGIDGTPYATFDRYIPCNTTGAALGQYTSCCAPGDICLTNGLCQSQGDNNRKANLFWRNGCTDPTWNDPACPKHCEGLDKPDTHAVFYCLKADSWCCSTGSLAGDAALNTTCCSRSDLTFRAADPLMYTTAEISNMVSTAITSARIATTPTPASQNPAVSSASLPTQTFQSSLPSSSSSASTSSSSSDNKTGMYVGVPLGIALGIALAVIAWLLVKNRKLKQGQAMQYKLPDGYVAYPRQPEYVPANELGTPPGELPTTNYMSVELGAEK